MNEPPSVNRMPLFVSGRRACFFVAACTVAGLALRAALAGRSGIWRDEAQFLFVVRLPSLAAMLDFLGHHESHPPLFYLLMRAWLSAFGGSERAALALPVLLGVVLIPIAYAVGKHVFSPGAGLIAAPLVAASPLLARYSAMVRPYSLLPLLCLLSVYSLWCGLRKHGTWPWVLHVPATLALVLAHNWGWLVLGAEWVVAAAWLSLRRQPAGWSSLRSWAIASALILVGYAPWLPVLLHQTRHAGYDASSLHPFLIFAHFAEAAVSLPVAAAVPVCLALIVAALWHAASRRTMGLPPDENQRLTLSLFVGIPLLAFALATILSAKTYVLFSQCLATIVPCVLLTIAHAVASLSSLPRAFALAITSVYLLFSLNLLGDIKSNAREAAALVARSAKPSDLILITPVWMQSSFNYYNTCANPQINYPQQGGPGAIDYDDLRDRLLDPERVAQARARLAQAHQQGRRVWLVIERDILSDRVPATDQLPPASQVDTFTHIGHLRANQLRKELNALYGPPSAVAVPLGARAGQEILQVALYGGEPGRACAPQAD